MKPGARRRNVTVADVAAKASVSKAQAARALGAYGAVSDDVRKRVLTAAEELRYRPNEVARSMNTGKSNTIGVVVGDIENPYFGLVMRGISDTAKTAGYDVILINTSENVSTEIEAVRVLVDKRVDGLLVAPASSNEVQHLRSVHESGWPLVFVDRRIDELDVDSVEVETRSTAYEATAHLIAAGHEEVAFISTLDTGGVTYRKGMQLNVSSVSDRISGMAQALEDAGIVLREELVRLNALDASAIASVTRELLNSPEPPTAIIASDSVIAQQVLQTILDLGLRIPDDVSFIMFDDFPWTRLLTPPATVISQPAYAIGISAANQLIAKIKGEPTGENRQVYSGSLIQRGSVGAPRAALSSRVRRVVPAAPAVESQNHFH